MKNLVHLASMILTGAGLIAAVSGGPLPVDAAEPILQVEDAETSEPAEDSTKRAFELLDADSVPLEDRLSEVQSILERHPELAEVWALLGELRLQAEMDEPALLAFERAVAKDPSLYSAWHWTGIIRKRMGDLEGALEAFEKALENGAPASREKNEIAVTLANLGRMEEALNLWEEAILDDPEWGVLYANAIKASLATGDEDKAEAYFHRGLEADRFEETSVLIWGEFLAGEKREKDAVKAYEVAASRIPANPKIRYYYGLSLKDRGKEEEAAGQLKLAIELAKEAEDETTQRAAELALFSVQHEKDYKRLTKAEELIVQLPDNPDKATKNVRKGVDILEPILVKHPELWDARVLRGIGYRLLKENSLARLDFEKVLTKIPDQPTALFNMALIHTDEGETDQAAEFAWKAVESGTANPQILLQCGFLLIDAGDCEKANEVYQKALSFYPPSRFPEGEYPFLPLQEELDVRCK